MDYIYKFDRDIFGPITLLSRGAYKELFNSTLGKTMQFTDEELKALYNIVVYASKDLSIEDEPLIYELYTKLKQFIVGSIDTS